MHEFKPPIIDKRLINKFIYNKFMDPCSVTTSKTEGNINNFKEKEKCPQFSRRFGPERSTKSFLKNKKYEKNMEI